jgi:hypothetical protein
MSNQNPNLNDPRVKFVTEVLEEIRSLLLHDQTQSPVHRIRISIDLEAGTDEIRGGWGRSFPRT